MLGRTKEGLPHGHTFCRVGGAEGASRECQGELGVADQAVAMDTTAPGASTCGYRPISVEGQICSGQGEEVLGRSNEPHRRRIRAGPTRGKGG